MLKKCNKQLKRTPVSPWNNAVIHAITG